MVVVADTSPINYLVLIAQIDLLQQLYARILIPPAVLAELKHPAAPKPVRDWADNPPKWVEVLSPRSSIILAQLDLGKSEAIALATEVHAVLAVRIHRRSVGYYVCAPHALGWKSRLEHP